MTKPYEKPTITRINNRHFAKCGIPSKALHPIRSQIDRVAISDLVAEFGSPLFVFSEDKIRATYREFHQLIAARYSNVTFGWSYKTNYLNAICRVFHDEGAIAEVVSGFEYQKARKLGVAGKDIIFNGPYKSLDDIRMAVADGALINCDHMDEINLLEQVAEENKSQIDIGIRLNMATGQVVDWSRFGFNIESQQAINAIRRIKARGLLKVTALHCHIGTFVLDPEAYGRAASKVVMLAKEIEETFGFKIGILDFGGGFPSRNNLRGLYQPPEIAIPPLASYAEALTLPLRTAYSDGDGPRLVIESGRAMIDEAGFLITTIVGSKLLPDTRRSYILDAGVNLLYTATWYKFQIELDGAENGIPEPCLLNGPLCMNIDVINESLMMPRLPRGKRLVLSPVGAYNVTQWMQFIHFRPAVVMIDANGEPHIIREREDLSAVEWGEKIPEHLRPKLKAIKGAA